MEGQAVRSQGSVHIQQQSGRDGGEKKTTEHQYALPPTLCQLSLCQP